MTADGRFDYIIAGAGAAGLSLAYHLHLAGLDDKRVLLLDRAPKSANDRTWCFWEDTAGAFEHLVFRRWERIAFFGAGDARVLTLAPYCYKMIRSEDFYAFMTAWTQQRANITWHFAEVTAITDADDGAIVHTRDGQTFRGQWIFSSIQLAPPPPLPKRHYLLQHFLGWVIATPQPAFDPSIATLMDFRVEQQDDTRFAYVLPFDEQTALVEYTVFSPQLLPRAAYVRGLADYIAEHLRIARYERQHEEFGVIPMTDAPFPAQFGRHVINIGTAGGCTKPSTGYTFRRIQHRSQHIAHALKATGAPHTAAPPAHGRFALYDSVLLNVLALGRDRGSRVFTDLFSRNPPQRVLRFLDEETTLPEEIQIMASVNIPAFLAAAADVLRRRM